MNAIRTRATVGRSIPNGEERMLILFVCASLTFPASACAYPLPTTRDTIKSRGQDTVARRDTNLIPENTILQGNLTINMHSPTNNLFGQQIDQQHFANAVDSLLKNHPEVRGAFLRELLIPSGSLVSTITESPLESFNKQLLKDSRFGKFERMSLIAKGYQLSHANDNSLQSHQLDILGTIQWLLETLK